MIMRTIGSQKKESAEAIARREMYDLISRLQGVVEKVASNARVLSDLRRELASEHRYCLLMKDCAAQGIFEERQAALIEGVERLREDLSYLVEPSHAIQALSLMMTLMDCTSKDPDSEIVAESFGANAFRIAAQAVFACTQLSRLCDLDTLPLAAVSPDAPDPVAASASQAMPPEDRMNEIVAAGATCVALLKEFCSHRGIETR